jgi:hypothetical protein
MPKIAARRVVAAFATLALAASCAGVLAGCGGSGVIDPVAKAAEVTSSQQGARISLREVVSTPAGPFTITGAGFINQRQRSGSISMDVSGPPGLSGEAAALAGQRIDFEFQYPRVYVRIPALASELGGKSWIALDLQKASAGSGIDLSSLSSSSNLDPSQFLNYLRATGGKDTNLGHATVDGVPTTRYRVQVDLEGVVSRLPAEERAAAKASVEKLEQLTGVHSLPVEAWVDSSQRVRRFAMQMNLLGAAAGSSVQILVDYTSFGAVPSVQPPAPGETYDLSSALKEGLAQGKGG